MLLLSSYFFLWAVILRTRYPISMFIFALISFSFMSGWLVGHELYISTFGDFFNLIFSVFVLSCFAFSFCFCRTKQSLAVQNIKFFKFVSVLLVVFLLPALVFNFYIVRESISYILSGNVSITEYKNQGEAARLIRIWFHPGLVFYVNLVSGAGTIAILYQFYFLNSKKYFLSILFFLLSLNPLLVGMHGLSRSSAAQFVLMYSCLYLYIYPSLLKDVRSKCNSLLLLLGIFVLSAFLFVSFYRFSDSDFYQIPKDSIIQNKLLYSILDYFSQWVVNGISVLKSFSLNDMWYGKSSISIFDYFVERLGFSVESYLEIRSATLGIYSSKFNGLIATLVYDYSHIGTIYFVCFFAFIVRIISSRGNHLNGYSLPLIGFLLSIPVLFFSNNYLSNEVFSLSGIYAALFFVASKIRFSFSMNSGVAHIKPGTCFRENNTG